MTAVSYGKTVQVWDGRPWTVELRTDRAALGAVRFLRNYQKWRAPQKTGPSVMSVLDPTQDREGSEDATT